MISLDLPHKLGKGPNEIYICCVLCPTRVGKPDEKFRLGINLKSGLYHCYRCGANRHNSSLKFLDNLEFYNQDDPEMDQLIETLDNLGSKKVLDDIDLDKYTTPIHPDETPIAYKYITEIRKLNDDDIKKYNIRVGKSFWTTDKDGNDYESNRWCGRIVFPFMEQGKAKFLVGRTYTNSPVRYLNSDDRKKDAYVYGIDNIKNRTAILCEGIISAIAAEKATGVSAVSTLGCFSTELQLVKLSQRLDRVYLCLDGGVDKLIAKRLEKQLLSLDIEVLKISLPDESDPDDLGQEFIKYFQQAKLISLF